jgi:hypothetical protein
MFSVCTGPYNNWRHIPVADSIKIRILVAGLTLSELEIS